jgi:hypothetical protein
VATASAPAKTKFPVDGWTKAAGEWMGAEGFLKSSK